MAYRYSIKIILTGCFFLLLSCSKGVDDSVSQVATEKDKKLLCEGDLVLRRGKGFVSQLIVDHLNDGTNLSHIGVLIKERESLFVIHCLGREFSDLEGIQLCTLDQFLADCYNDGFLVVRNTRDLSSDISLSAKSYLNKQIPFDRKFDFSDSTAFSCLELPYSIFKYLDVYYEDMTTFKPFLDKSRFETVIDKRKK